MSYQTRISEDGKIIEEEPSEPKYSRCRRCGRKLSNPLSMRRGYGPVCWKKIGGKSVKREDRASRNNKADEHS